jgi:predicted MFS family arabinose efflux permease
MSPIKDSTVPPSEVNKEGFFEKWYTLILLTVVYAFNVMDRQILTVLLEPIKADLGISDTLLGVLTGISFALFYATLGVPIAILADRSNRRNIISIAVAVWSAMTVVTGMAQNFIQILLARIGVGIGEAGCLPPSQSITSDIFPPQERSMALAVLSSGANIGLFFGFILGAYLYEYWGWRVAFFALGAPGLLLGLIVHFTLKEPVRGMSDNTKEAAKTVPFREVLRFIATQKSLLYVFAACTSATMCAYGVSTWIPSYFIRVFDMSIVEVGTTLAIIFGICGGVGTISFGIFADKMGKRDVRWKLWVNSLLCLALVPMFYFLFSASSAATAVALTVLPLTLLVGYLGSTWALNQSLVPPEMRSVTASLMLLSMNLIGLGLGPFLVGLISDALSSYGADSLRYSLRIFIFLYVVPAIFYYLASINLKHDLGKISKTI